MDIRCISSKHTGIKFRILTGAQRFWLVEMMVGDS